VNGKHVFALGIYLVVGSPVCAAVVPAPLDTGSEILLVAQGCGPGWYRGPYGACHRFGYGPGLGYFGPGWGRRGPPYWGPGVRRCWQGPYGAWHCR
jgi:hypothetical protein